MSDFSQAAYYAIDMRLTCEHARHLSKMVQIRNVADALHRKLTVRAAASPHWTIRNWPIRDAA